jgi:hypothetical protein
MDQVVEELCSWTSVENFLRAAIDTVLLADSLAATRSLVHMRTKPKEITDAAIRGKNDLFGS